MNTRPWSGSRERLIVWIVILSLVVTIIYLYLNNLQETYKSVQWSSERCTSELTSVKYQLNVVTEYKNRIDKLLTEAQQEHQKEKQRFLDIVDSCVAMKQQVTICQSQFEDLQSECKKVKENYDKVFNELEKLKTA